MTMATTPLTSVSTPATTAKPARLGDSLMGQLGTLLTKALADLTSLEVRTFTSDAAESALATTGDPLAAHTRLRAFTRVAIDGDTQLCVPLRASGEPDEALWKLHAEAVAQAREDRARTIAAAISVLKELAHR
jgi:hypothetical protein